MWDTESGACTSSLEDYNTGWFVSLAFSSDGRHIASGYAQGAMRIWNIEIGACTLTLQGHKVYVNSVAFSSDGRYIASGSGGEVTCVKICDVESGACSAMLGASAMVSRLRFNCTGSHLYTDIGIIPLGEMSTAAVSEAATTLRYFKPYEYGISNDCRLITWYGKNVLGIPSGLRPRPGVRAFDSLQQTIAIGCTSGRAWSIEFSADKPPIV